MGDKPLIMLNAIHPDKDGLQSATIIGHEQAQADSALPNSQEKLLDEQDKDVEIGSGTGEDETCGPALCLQIATLQTCVGRFYQQHKSNIKTGLLVLAVLLYVAYLIAACVINFHRAKVLVVITGIVVTGLFCRIIKSCCGSRIRSLCWEPVCTKIKNKWCIIKWIMIIAVVLLVVVLTAVIIGPRPRQYVGLIGLTVFTVFLFVTSNNPSKVQWRPVLWGMLLNFFLAVFILKTPVGLQLFDALGSEVTKFLGYTDAGSQFVFGVHTYTMHFFAFKILPTIVFFSCVISLLYYVGVMQFVIRNIAMVMQFTMGTTATESLSCAGNIFVGQTEAPILIRPFLETMTMSELHAVMTGGFATIAGGVLAAYIGIGIEAVHLICASVMNAPMALAVSKLYYPETDKSKAVIKIKFEEPTEQNFIEAAAAGASQSIGLVANIAANLIAFLALLAFINAALSWFGGMLDFPQLSFQIICSYLFWPVAVIMGVDVQDCPVVAELLGTKIFVNEFVAYQQLSVYIRNREQCLAGTTISRRSASIVTYALCGFANLSSVGVQLGGIGAMAPSRRADLAKLCIRALIAGTLTTMMTASLAGMLVTDFDGPEGLSCLNVTIANSTHS